MSSVQKAFPIGRLGDSSSIIAALVCSGKNAPRCDRILNHPKSKFETSNNLLQWRKNKIWSKEKIDFTNSSNCIENLSFYGRWDLLFAIVKYFILCCSIQYPIIYPGLVVMGGYFCSKGCGFESWLCILDGHDIVQHIFVVRIVMFVWKDKNKWKRGRGWSIYP